MYVILVYDVGEERVNRICRYLRQYLPRVQNSVFEGELPESKLEKMKAGLLKRLECDTDSVLLWVMRDSHLTNRQILGKEKLPVSNIL